MTVTELERPETRIESQARVLHLRPLGPQGPKIGVQVCSVEDFKLLDEKMGELSEADRKTVDGVMKAIGEAHLPIIDF